MKQRLSGVALGVADSPGWGGHSGVFVAPDSHPWEIAHNPHWRLTEDGGVRLA